MDSYALCYRERSSRSFSLGTRHITFNSSIRHPPVVTESPPPPPVVNTQDGQENTPAQEVQVEPPPTPKESSPKGDSETESPKDETPAGIEGSSESP